MQRYNTPAQRTPTRSAPAPSPAPAPAPAMKPRTGGACAVKPGKV